MKLEPTDKVYLSESEITNAGRGVFAKTDIASNEIIEICPVIVVPSDDTSNKKGAVLVDYFFYFGDRLGVALGFGSLYNHSYEPNATYIKNLRNDTIEFKAIKSIKKDTEITVNYNFGKAEDKSQPFQKGIPPAE